MNRTMTLATLLLALVAVAALALSVHFYRRASQLERLVAVSWGDGKYGKAFYGAYVFYEDHDGQDGPLLVKLAVRIDRGTLWSQYAHDTRQLGVAKDAADAVEKWGVITWSDKGLTVGRTPENAHFFPRDDLERHR